MQQPDDSAIDKETRPQLDTFLGERYRAMQRLSAGPSCATFLATDVQSGRDVVVKRIPARLVSAGRACGWNTKPPRLAS